MSRLRPFVVGLTGGIGSGKTTVTQWFADKGVEVVDADVISRALVAKDQPLLQQLVGLLGPGILLPDGTLDRSQLRQRLFTDAGTKQQVEALMHPAIRSAIVERVHRSSSAWLLLAAPLLLESGAYDFVDRVLVVDAPEALQRSRTAQRDNVSEAEVERIMQSQLNRTHRLERADDVISNDSDLASLQLQVDTLFNLYQHLADERQHAINAL